MSFGSILDLAVVMLPTALSAAGVWVSLKAPESKHHGAWRWGLIGLGVALSVATGWQQSRSRAAHDGEVKSLNGEIGGLNSQVDGLKGKISDLQQSVTTMTSKAEQESALRKQADADMKLMVQVTGQLTRAGVGDDLRKAPISVSVNGASGTAVNQSTMDALAGLIADGYIVQQAVPLKDAPPEKIGPWLDSLDTWWTKAATLIQQKCRPQALVVASDRSHLVTMGYSGIQQDQRVQNAFLILDRLIGNLTELVKRPELCP